MLNSMGARVTDHVWILLSILFTTCSQVLIKWQVSHLGKFPEATTARFQYLAEVLLRPWILVAFVSTFLAGATWMVALGKFEISYAFPFYALNFLLIFLAGIFLFSEPLTGSKIIGLILILAGVVVLSGGAAGHAP